MKIVCPFCKGRLHTVYIRTAESGKFQFTGLGNYFWCAIDEMIFVPSRNLAKVSGPGMITPKGFEFMGNAKRLVPEPPGRKGPSSMKPTRRRIRASMLE